MESELLFTLTVICEKLRAICVKAETPPKRLLAEATVLAILGSINMSVVCGIENNDHHIKITLPLTAGEAKREFHPHHC